MESTFSNEPRMALFNWHKDALGLNRENSEESSFDKEHIKEERSIRRMFRSNLLCENWNDENDRSTISGEEMSWELDSVETTAELNRNIKIAHLCNENIHIDQTYPSPTEEARMQKLIKNMKNAHELNNLITDLCEQFQDRTLKVEWLKKFNDANSINEKRALASSLLSLVKGQ